MQKRIRVLITFTFLIVLVAGLYVFTDWFSKVTGYFFGEAEKEKVARCLKEKNAEFYGSEYCVECEKQQEEFGQAFKLIVSIDCEKKKENCPNIREIPAWYINKTLYYGFRNLTELKMLASCGE